MQPSLRPKTLPQHPLAIDSVISCAVQNCCANTPVGTLGELCICERDGGEGVLFMSLGRDYQLSDLHKRLMQV